MKKFFLLSLSLLAFLKTSVASVEEHFTGRPESISFNLADIPDLSGLTFVLSNYGFKSPATLTLVNKESDKLGMVHYRYIETYDNNPVDGTMWLVHTRNGKIVSMNGVLYAKLPSSNSITVSEEDAYKDARIYMNAQSFYPTSASGNLYWAVSKNDVNAQYFRLCYRFDIYSSSPLARKYVFVDVSTGKVIAEHSRLDNTNATGTAVTVYSGVQTITTDSYNGSYRLRETGRGDGIETYDLNNGTDYSAATDFTDADNYWDNVNANLDQYATDAHWGAEKTYDFYFKTFNRNSVDNAGLKLRSYVHYSTGYLNAFWNGVEMTYGDGCCGATPLTALDITGHEISHGVTEFTAALIYSDESGALNESFSDCMGTSIEFYGKPASANWLIGEDIGFAFRNMANPKQYQQPDTYHGQYWYTGSSDYGGVHTNSGVMNYWFYLVSQGGKGVNDIGNSYNIRGVTIQEAEAIAYRMQSIYMFPTAQYVDARQWSIQAATDLYGACSQEVVTVTNAWYAVGVGAIDTTNAESINISANPGNIICPGTSVTFTAAATNGGNSPVYEWEVNGVISGSNKSIFTTAALQNGDKVTCTLLSSASCTFPNPAVSDSIAMVIDNSPPTVSISASPGNIISSGTTVTFTAAPVKGGTNPTYQWKLNGANVGTNSPTYVNNSLTDGSVVTCIMTSDASCTNGIQATSNTISITVNQPFIDVTSGVIPANFQNENARILAVMDYNNDNMTDIFLRYSPDGVHDHYTILKNNGGVYTDVGASLNFPNTYCRFFDFNNDGFIDVASLSGDTLRIYKNNGGVSFSLYSTVTNIPMAGLYYENGDGQYGLYDYDNDGDLDFVYVTGSTLMAVVNDYQSGSFNQTVVLINNWPANAIRFKMFDMDNDGDLDIVAQQETSATTFGNDQLYLYRNNGNGTFTDVTASSGLNPGPAYTGCDIFDINQDGKLDIIKGGADSSPSPGYRVFISNGDGTFVDETNSYAIKPTNLYEEKLTSIDFNNDSYYDYSWAYVEGGSGATNRLYKNNGANTFTEVATSYALNLGSTTGGGSSGGYDNVTYDIWFDYNNDGALDNFISDEKIYNTKNGKSWMMKNPLGGNYLNVRLVGCASNREGRGSKVVAKINGKDVYAYYVDGANTNMEDNTSIFHFGLGNVTTADSITVYWPSGNISRLGKTNGNTLLTINENSIPASINISANPGFIICAGTSVTFTAVPHNGGSAPVYQWLVNKVNAGTNSSTFTTSSLSNGDTVTCILTSSLGCAVPNPSTSNGINIIIDNTPSSVNITASPGTVVTSGTTVTFTAHPVKGGTAPIYQWKLDGVNVGSNTSTYVTNTLSDSDKVECIMTSNASCANGAIDTSNIITIIIPGGFINVTSAAFPVTYLNPRVIAVIDYNNDNKPDLFFRYSPDGVKDQYTILKNNNGVYEDVGASLNCPNAYARFFDFNNDGYIDMMTFSGDTINIYQNNLGKSFSLYSTITGIPSISFYDRGSDGEFGLYDYDNDGDLDILYVDSLPNNMRLNAIVNDYKNGNFNQKKVVISTLPLHGTRFKMFDMDNDGDLDIVGNVYDESIAFNNEPMFLYRNDGNGNFTDVTATSGLNPNQAAAGCDIFDINQDGRPDIIRGGDDSGTPPLYRVFINNGDGTFTDQTTNYAIRPSGTYVDKFNAVDFDNDGNMDYNWTFVDATGVGTNKLYQNNGSNVFSEVSATYAINLGTVNGNCCPIDNATHDEWFDYNSDGSMDVFISREKIHGVKNGIGWMMKNYIGGNYLNVRLVGCASNREGRGARIVAKINGKNNYQYYVDGANTVFENNTSIFHFGLGSVTTVDSITVYWPSGQITRLANVQGNALLTIPETEPAGITITANPGNTFCAGTPVTFTATPVGGGNLPTYQWKLNGVNVGTNNATYTNSSLANNDVVSCFLKSSSFCADPDTATSAAIKVTVNPLPVVTAGNVSGCSSIQLIGSPAGGTFSVTNPYTGPSTNYTYTYTDANGCSNTSSAASITISGSGLTASVTILASPGDTICAGTPVTFTASPVNGGSLPSYQWQVNGANAGANNPIFVDGSLGNNNAINCLLTSNQSCVSGTPVSSNTINMTVTPLPAISISGSGIICDGSSGALTASGATDYSWSPSTGLTATTGSRIRANPPSTTIYTVTGTSTSGCSAIVTDTLTVFPAPVISFSVSENNKTVSFTTDSAGGGITSYSWNFGDGFAISNNVNPVHTYDTLKTYYVCLTVYNNSNCSFSICKYVEVGNTGIQTMPPQDDFQLYPNPATNKLLLVSAGLPGRSIAITNLLGQTLIEQIPDARLKQTIIDISILVPGIYLLEVKDEEGIVVKKFVKE